MHICFMGRSVLEHGAGAGGMEVHGSVLTRALAAGGDRVTLVTTAHPRGLAQEESGGTRILYLPGTTTGQYGGGYFEASVACLLALHAREPVDVVVGQSAGARGYVASPARKQLGIPCASIFHGLMSWEYFSSWASARGLLARLKVIARAPRVVRELCRGDRSFLAMDALIAVSRELADAMRSQYRPAADRVHCVLNGVDTDRFRPDADSGAELRGRLGIPDAEVVFLMAGRLLWEKGFHVGLEALARLASSGRPVHALIAGSGPAEPELRELARPLSARGLAHFLGHVASLEIARCYSACDVFLLPTLRWEGLPLAVAEALACGKPVIATRRGGVGSALVDGVTGRLIEPGDASGLVRAMDELAADAELRARMGAAARADAVARLSRDRMVAETRAILAGLAGAR
ncbi:MAG: glycosyltransferase family 4 protein [Candidatus Wallbacteria bacterium]|nr:glycosyltransferase family 4 protein [Candidatus Wallbacteria bacterium]